MDLPAQFFQQKERRGTGCSLPLRPQLTLMHANAIVARMSAKRKTSNPSRKAVKNPSASPADDESRLDGDADILEAVRLLIGTDFVKSTRHPHWMDEMLLLRKSSAEQAALLLSIIGEIMRPGVRSLMTWASAHHSPEIASKAQMILADMVQALEGSGIVRVEQRGIQQWPEFQARRNTLVEANGKRTQLSAVPLFVRYLLKAAEGRICSIWDADSAPSDDMAAHSKEELGFTNFVNAYRKLAEKMAPDERELFSPIEAFRAACRHPDRSGKIFDNLLWPLAKLYWPEWAREHEDTAFCGGAKLSSRKRQADGKTDFGIEKLRPQIRNNFMQLMASERASRGDGHPLDRKRQV